MDTTLEEICVRPSLSISEVVKVLNNGHRRIILVTDEDGRLLGVVADPDIRRAILKRLSFESPVSDIMITKPVVASADMKESKIFSLMQTTHCYEIPIIDRSLKVVGLKTIDSFIGEKQRAEAVIMAGGLGKRLRPLTETVPKPLLPIGGKPILFILIDRLIRAGFEKITLTLNYKADMIKNAVTAVPEYENIVHFVYETARLGTAGALSLIEYPPIMPFFVMNADLMTKVDFPSMWRFHEMESNLMTMAVREETYQIPFGVVRLKGTRILEIEEKPIHSYFANAGIYVIDPSLLSFVPKNTFYDMPDLINDVIASEKKVGSFPIHEYWADIGNYDELQRVRNDER